ncbi:MAG: hypothetical protein M3Q44_03490 [bacterium]|nr:hypothetical protein [bacterium]
MIGLIALILIVLWFLGYIRIESFPIPDFQLFQFNARPVSLWDLLIFLVVCWAIAVLPTPLRQIAGVLLVLWTLALFGIIAITGFSQVIVIAIIAGLLFSLFSRRTI